MPSTPVIDVTNIDGSTFAGDTIITFMSQSTGAIDTLIVNNATQFAYPFFQMAHVYPTVISVYTLFINGTHPSGTIIDKVPEKGATLTINNRLMMNYQPEVAETDANGQYYYTFKVGAPGTSDNGNKTFTETYEVNAQTSTGSYIVWRENNLFRGYILGAKPLEGTDFVTYGPDIVDVILRDPPGSNSYAYMEKGSSYSNSQSWNIDTDSETAMSMQLSLGVDVELGGGLAGPVWDIDTQLDSELGVQVSKSYNESGNYEETVTFTEVIATSSDPDDVGSMADLYIGKSRNAFMSKSENVQLMKKSYCDYWDLTHYPTNVTDTSAYVLAVIDGLVMNDNNESTYFIYTQSHIVNYLIPNLIATRDNFLMTNPAYTSELPATHKYFGFSNTSESLLDFMRDSLSATWNSIDTTQLSYTVNMNEVSMDSVNFINQQVGIWISQIALNEAEKVNASLMQNISFDGAGGNYESSITETYSSENNYASERRFDVYSGTATGLTVNGLGFSLSTKYNSGMALGSEQSSSVNNSITFGYVLDEDDHGDYYSVDVLKSDGVAIFSYDEFVESFVDNQPKPRSFGESVTDKIAANTLKATERASLFGSAPLFKDDLTESLARTNNFQVFAGSVQNDIDNNGKLDITSFGISSPIFRTRGGQSMCPYEGDEYTSFYVDPNTGDYVPLNVATLVRQVPGIAITPTVISNVPEGDVATFTLVLTNESESNSANWYELSYDEDSNQDGAVILMDGTVLDTRTFYLDPHQTINKTITVSKGQAGIMDYQNLGLIFHSMCQYDPTDDIGDIADSVYFTVNFQPECAKVEIENIQDNWVVNYSNNNEVNITLSGYDLNHSTLENLDIQYKTLSGTPTPVWALVDFFIMLEIFTLAISRS